MRVLIAVAAVALASAADPSYPQITLQVPNDNESATIVWDGETLTIPQHTDRLDGHQSHLGMLDTNVSVIHRTLYHLEAKLNETSRILAEVQQNVSLNTRAIRDTNERIGLVEDDILANGNLITSNGEKIKARACKAGKYRNEQGNCLNCPAGRYKDVAGATGGCKNCNTGRYQDLVGMPGCKNCGAGKYQNLAGKLACKDCGAGKYDNRPVTMNVPRPSCPSTCTTCPASWWTRSRCTATANTVCVSKWTTESTTRPCNSRYGTRYTSLSSAKNACVGDSRCHGVSYVKKGGTRWHPWHGSNHRRRSPEFHKCSSENLHYERMGLASAFYDYNARPCEITALGDFHCPTWN